MLPAGYGEGPILTTKYMFGKDEIEVELPCPNCGNLVRWYYRKSVDVGHGEIQNIPPVIECKCAEQGLLI